MHIGQADADPSVQGLTWERLTTEAVRLNTDPMPYVPFFNQQYPTKSSKIEFYVEMLSLTTRPCATTRNRSRPRRRTRSSSSTPSSSFRPTPSSAPTPSSSTCHG